MSMRLKSDWSFTQSDFFSLGVETTRTIQPIIPWKSVPAVDKLRLKRFLRSQPIGETLIFISKSSEFNLEICRIEFRICQLI